MSGERYCRDGKMCGGVKLRADNRNPDGKCGYCQAGVPRPDAKRKPMTAREADALPAVRAKLEPIPPYEGFSNGPPVTKSQVFVGIDLARDADETALRVRGCGECPMADALMQRCQHPGVGTPRHFPVFHAAERPQWCPLVGSSLRIAAA